MRPILASVAPSHDHNNLETIHHNINNHQSTENNLPLETNHTNALTSDTCHLNTKQTPPNASAISEPINNNNFLLDPASSLVPTISVFVHSATKPPTSANIQDCFDRTNPLRSFWIQTAYEQYDKNASYRVFTRPVPKRNLPPNSLILKSVLAPTVKPTDIDNLWKLNIRHCVNGRPMKGLIEYGQTRASTVHPDTVRFQIAYSTSKGFKHRTFDCTNAFQCTFEDDPQKCINCYLPPFYQYWYNSRYPHDNIDPTDGPYVLQAAQLIQGSPHAANRWQENLHAQLTIGYIRNNIDHSFYTKFDDKNEIEALLSITVDDFLLSYRTEATQKYFYDQLSSAFDITTPSDITKLKFLSLTIYQSKYGTSIDQTGHIQSKILAPWFDDGHLPKIVNSPFPTDTNYEEDLAQSPPLEGEELKLYEKRYHGAFNQSIGKLLHIQQWTRLDINFAVT